MPLRSLVVLAWALLLVGCALPPNAALRDWARSASVAADRPGLLATSERADALAAQQEALAVYLYVLGVLATKEQPVTFRADSYAVLPARAAALDPASGQAVAQIGAILDAAREGNLPPGARANSAAPAPLVEDTRLPRVIRAADPQVQVLILAISAGLAGGADPDRETYLRLLAALREDHAMITARAGSLASRELERDLHAAEDRLARIARLLPADPVVAARSPPGGMVALVAQP